MKTPAALRGVRAAFVFFTRIPVGGFPYQPADWSWAAAHAPLVGLVLGAALGVVDAALLHLGSLSAGVLVVGASLLLTGAFHEDGFADTSDALGGSHDRERVFAILKDSRIGVFGGAALAVSIAGRAALLAQLGRSALWALPLAWSGARVGPIWLMATTPYVTPSSEAKSRLLTGVHGREAAVATAWFAVALAVAVGCRAVPIARAEALAVALAAVTWASRWRYVRRVGGITGDFLGATEQLGELAALAVLAWA